MQSPITTNSVFRIYRLSLSGLLTLSAVLASGSAFFTDATQQQLFLTGSLIWFTLALTGTIFSLRFGHSAGSNTIHLIVDITALAFLSWGSGGLESGISYLMLPTAAIAGVLLTAKLALFIAAYASLSIIVGQYALFLYGPAIPDSVYSAGILGIMLFAFTVSFKTLERRLSASETRAKESDARALEYRQISEAVITQMLSGVLVVDEKKSITLINPSAERLLTAKSQLGQRLLDRSLEEFPNLNKSYDQWQNEEHPGNFVQPLSGIEIQPYFRDISLGENIRTLITLENTYQIKQKAQQAKVFGLGKLSASIAHEVRNPLSAINQANDLLNESDHLSDEDKKLVNIISRHCDRMDKTIDVANQLSKQLEPKFAAIDLEEYLLSFVSEYQEARGEDYIIHTTVSPSAIVVFDTQHLTQVIRNLVDNGVRYSEESCGKKDVAILATSDESRRIVYIDIHDRGLGMAEDEVEEAFSPFHSKSGGAGIGLYLCRELCEANFASLNYLYKSSEQESGFFRITGRIETPYY